MESYIKSIKIVVLAALVGVGVAITYHYFEASVRNSINYIWDDLFNTNEQRLLLVPVSLVLTTVYFAAQHYFDRDAEKKESHGLGSTPKPTVINFIKVLSIGFLSLVAGASLGPEAVLVPACVLLGGYLGIKVFGENKQTTGLFGILGFVALFAAFFNSFFVGLLALLLVKKQFKININLKLLFLSALASGSTIIALGILDSSAYLNVPDYSWKINGVTILTLVVLLIVGFFITYAMNFVHILSVKLIKPIKEKQWWVHALIASGGLSILYLIGGSLVEFTGNESIVPMFKQSADLGLLGLVWILVVKISAISWSKAGGYRGGLIFPTIFVASVVVAIASLYESDLNFIYGIIAVIVGALVADSKVKFLV